MSSLRKSELALLEKVLAVYHPDWARALASGVKLPAPLESKITSYLTSVAHGLCLFVPAAHPAYGVTERGGDAVVAYFTRPGRRGARPSYVMIDVSGFTKLLTFLTDRFGKQEAGDIMNMSILNRYCLNRMGTLIACFGSAGVEQDSAPAADALKSALSFRSILGTITTEVRDELTRKLAGKPHQDEIRKFIKDLEIKASAGVVAGQSHGRSEFYGGGASQARITWGRSARHLAGSEKVGGSDYPVHSRLPEVKGVGYDDESAAGFQELLASGWLDKRDFRSRRFGEFEKVVLTPRGMDRLSERTWDTISEFERKQAAAGDEIQSLADTAGAVERAAPYLQGGELVEQVVRGLGPEAKLSNLFDDRSSRVHETGILFANFTVSSGGLLDELSAVVHNIMTRYGLVYKYNIFPMGDFNLMACLGLEVAGAPETERFYTEVLWQCWQDLVSDSRRSFAGRVNLRAGMSVGQCLQGPVGDNLLHNELTIIGPDCNLAARLVARALVRKEPPGSLLAARNSYAKVEHLVAPVEPFERAELKGFREPVPLYSLLPRGEQETPVQLAERLRRLPLVTGKGQIQDNSGRAAGDTLLAAASSFVADFGGRQQVNRMLGFHGSAGLGKTRRLAEIIHNCAEDGWPVLWAECMSYYQGSGGGDSNDGGSGMAVPFHPFIKILTGQVFGILSTDTPAQEFAKLRKVSRALLGTSAGAQELAVVASFLGIDSGDREVMESMSPEDRRNVFFEQVTALFEALIAAHGKRLLLVIDDLQWADASSLKLLSYLLGQVGGGLLFCSAAREKKYLDSLLDDDSGGGSGFMLLEAKPLGQKGVRLLARVALGVLPESSLPAELDRRLGELENNPLFITEFCRKLLDNEVLFVRDGEVVRFESDKFAAMSVPNRVQSVIEELVSSLPRRDFNLIRNGSVLGNVMSCRDVAEINSAETGETLAPDAVRNSLHSLAGRKVLEIELDKGPDSVYRFSRALIGQSLYQGITPTLRKRLHAVAGQIWERAAEDTLEKHLNCAMHYELAEVPQKGAEYHLSAGNMAGELFENERALELLDKVERFCNEHRLEDSGRMLLDMHERRCNIALALGRYEKALHDSGRLGPLAKKLKQSGAAVRAELLSGRVYLTRARQDDFQLSLKHYDLAEKMAAGNPLLLLEARNGQSRVLLETGEIEKAEQRSGSALAGLTEIGADLSDPRTTILRARITRTLATARMRLGRSKEGVDTANEALEMIVEAGDGSEFLPVKAQLLNTRGICQSMAFQLQEALQTYYQARSIARKVGDVNLQLLILNNMSVTLNDSGENTRALDLLVSNYDAIHKLAGESRGLAGFEFNIGECYHFMGDAARAEKHYRRALVITERISSRQFGVNVMYNLGEALRDQDKLEEARQVLERGAKLAEENGYKQQLLDLENILGEMDMADGNPARAAERHRMAIGIARELNDDFGIGWSLRNLAEDLLAEGGADNCAEAGKLLTESLDFCRKAGQPENLLVTLASLLSNWDKLDLENSFRSEVLEELGKLARKIKSKKYQELYRKHGGTQSD